MRQRADILKATPEQLPEIAAIERECIPFGWSENALKGAFFDDKYIFLSAICKGKTVGFINGSVIADEAEIMNVAVLPEYRQNGIAKALVEEFFSAAEKRGARRIFLEVREKNIPASELYKKLGLTACGVRKNYYQSPTDNAIIMTKILKDGE